MILRSSLRHDNALLKATSHFLFKRPTPPTSLASQSRQIHSVPQVGAYDEQFSREGVPELLSPDAYRLAWTDYQQFMVDRLNTIIANDPDIGEGWGVKELAIATARVPAKASVFNYASMAHNNHFFFQCLSPTEVQIPTELKDHLNTSFHSVDGLRKTFLTTAAAMFGPGFVWLVQDRNPSPNNPSVIAAQGNSLFTSNDPSKTMHFRILTTYLAGSPYPGAHFRQQPSDMNVQNLQSADQHRRQSTPQNTVGAFGSNSAAAWGMSNLNTDPNPREQSRYGGANITPVLCVNTWEHAWMWDWGVAGKRLYLEKWWSRINWEHVWDNCVKKPTPRTQGGKAFLT